MTAKQTLSFAQTGKRPAPPASAPDDIGLFEMANLTTRDTGVDGIIYIATAQGSHAPRVKWYPGRPGDKAPSLSVTVETAPTAINNNLPANVAAKAADPVKARVTANRADLLRFWNEGAIWTRDEVNDFIDKLKKLG